MIIGIVGAEETKFTTLGRERAIALISELIADPTVEEVVSGECHLGGVDIWTKERTFAVGKRFTPFPPKVLSWTEGFMPRNLQIASRSDVVHNIVVDKYPKTFQGMKFQFCYHCKSDNHIKSGGCWTMKQAIARGKHGVLHIINNE